MPNTDRKVKRKKNQGAMKEASRVYRQALEQGARVEADLKRTISRLPWYQRFMIALRIFFRRWQ